MAKRKRIGLLYSYDERWIGGTYYVLNIIHALNVLPGIEKPIIVLYTDKKFNFVEVKQLTGYPYLKMYKLERKGSGIVDFCNRVSKKIIKKSIFNWSPPKAKVDIFYPKLHPWVDVSHLKQVFWIPDFQEAYLPHLFTALDIAHRKKSQQYICEHANIVVFSSQNASNHFKKLYPHYSKRIQILNFAVTHPTLNHLDKEEMFVKYSIDVPYFFAPNQFWQHKNHETLIRAVAIAIKENPLIKVLLSGKEEDYRIEGHVQKLKAMVSENKLEDHIRFLGFLPRDEQLFLLRHSIAVIQPSLFEGWSTVVEDAKAQNKYLILSDIDVHREQVANYVDFFDPLDSNALASVIIDVQKRQPLAVKRMNYKENILNFAKDFMKLLN